MSPHLPVVSGLELRRAFLRLGWIERRSTGHFQMMHPDKPGIVVSIPMHRTAIGRGLLKDILVQSGITVEQLREVL
jgi:predicted RNA binding protein YcfA (HicA-like mRNA interferase family)